MAPSKEASVSQARRSGETCSSGFSPRWLPRVANVTSHLRNPGSRSRAAEVSDGVLAASNPAHEAIHEGFRASGSEARSGTHVLLCVREVATPPIGREPKSLWPPIGQGLVSTDS